ncbi:hypothetical protein W909_04215 [Dickeya zeae EC1]|nr:hypothetical protein W909_04215 [Dickeya zeae EC1]
MMLFLKLLLFGLVCYIFYFCLRFNFSWLFFVMAFYKMKDHKKIIIILIEIVQYRDSGLTIKVQTQFLTEWFFVCWTMKSII